jgi:hypothetical protein
MSTGSLSSNSVPVYVSEQIRATDGANMGDAISFASELILDDVYELDLKAEPARLSLVARDDASFGVGHDTSIGTPGAQIHLDCALTFMSPEGAISDALLLVEVDAQGDVTRIYVMPLGALTATTEYRLVGIDRDTAHTTFAQVACVSFTRGTQITMASGAQRAVEDLVVGDRILTRDDGVQILRWIDTTTTRAVGEFAPIRIAAGTLNNTADLLVSPDHRLFIYQRTDTLGAGRAELLVKARHLVNGDTVTVDEGGVRRLFPTVVRQPPDHLCRRDRRREHADQQPDPCRAARRDGADSGRAYSRPFRPAPCRSRRERGAAEASRRRRSTQEGIGPLSLAPTSV